MDKIPKNIYYMFGVVAVYSSDSDFADVNDIGVSFSIFKEEKPPSP